MINIIDVNKIEKNLPGNFFCSIHKVNNHALIIAKKGLINSEG